MTAHSEVEFMSDARLRLYCLTPVHGMLLEFPGFVDRG